MNNGRYAELTESAATVSAAQAGNQRARDELIAAYLPLVYNIVGRALGGGPDVDDVVQEVMLHMVDDLAGLRDPGRFRSWLVAITMNQLRRYWRAHSAAPTSALQEALDVADPGADFVDLTIMRLALSGQRREVAEATRWLDSDDRALLSLWWLEAAGEIDRAELAEALELSPPHAAVRVQRMKAQLEAARVVVRALSAPTRCTELAVIAARWDNVPTALWRKRFARHARECQNCSDHGNELISAEHLLASLALVTVPVLLAATFAEHVAAPSVAAHASSAAGKHAARTLIKARHAKAGWVAIHTSPKLVVAATALTIAGSAVLYAESGSAPRVAASTAASSQRTAAPRTTSSPVSPSTTAPPSLGAGLTTVVLQLSAPLATLEPAFSQVPDRARVDTEVAPDGSLQVAWPAADGVHVTPLTSDMRRRAPDTVVAGAKEVGGLVAHNDGFALLTRVPDTNKWHETAAELIRYREGAVTFSKRLTGPASTDSAPMLNSRLKWDGTRYGAYFVVHGAGGWADGHFGDKLTYLSATGGVLPGGWSWGCSHNVGIALYPEPSGPFASLCFDDWRSGLYVSTGIGAPDSAPIVQLEQCTARGFCAGTYPGFAGSLVKSPAGRYATAFGTRGAATAAKNSGRGWTVASATATHQVAVAFLKNKSSPDGKPVLLTDESGVDHVNVRVAPYGQDRLLIAWEDVPCKSGPCAGTFTGTHLQTVDWSGKPVGAEQVVGARIGGDISVLPDGALIWAFAAPASASKASANPGYSPATLSVTRLRL